jgi:hypothetical protein
MAAEGYQFDFWGGDASGTQRNLSLTINSDKTIVASFSKIMYTLDCSVAASGRGTIDSRGGTYEAGTQVTVRANPQTGYRFDHWAGDASSTDNTLNIVMNANKTVTAYFMKVYSFSTSTSPADAGTISPSTGLRDAGTKVTLTATAKFPYAFTYWTGTDNDNVNPTTITMNSDISATAYFIKLSPGSAQTQPGKL